MLADPTVGFDDNDDSISLSDDSFMPPVLSDYANELLSDEIARSQLVQEKSDMDRKERTISILGDHTSTTRSRPRSILGTTQTGPSSKEESKNGQTENSTQHSTKSKEYSTPGQVGGRVFGGRAPSALDFSSKSVRSRRLGRGLDQLKRSYANEDKSVNSKPISDNTQASSALKTNYSPSQWRPSKIRFAEGKELAPLSFSNSIFSEESSQEDLPRDTSGPFGTSFAPTVVSLTTKATEIDSRTPSRKDKSNNSGILRPLSPNETSRMTERQNIAVSSQSTITEFQKQHYKHSEAPSLYHADEVSKGHMPYSNENHPSISPPLQSAPVRSQAAVVDKSKKKPKNLLAINGQKYQRLELIGKGGSSKVYKVQSVANDNKVYAVKKVTFDDLDISVIQGFKGEIDLLQRLRGEDRVVKLVDFEMFDTSVYLVMECGEIDLAHVLSARLRTPLDLSFVRYYAQEMLKCVEAVHRHGIVHSDLKPANFLLVKGMLKIIDFGIANIVPDYTSNIHRDTQIGTPNYMAPEALLDSNGGYSVADPFDTGAAKFKVGKPSDVWSCGCIIYQMIYGKPPYAGYAGHQRVLAITNPKVVVQYPKEGLGGVKVPREATQTIKNCISRNPSERQTISEVLNGSFLSPLAIDQNILKSLFENAIKYGSERGQVTNREMDQLASDVWKKLVALNSS